MLGVAATRRARAIPARIRRMNQFFKTTQVDTFGRYNYPRMPLWFPLLSLTQFVTDIFTRPFRFTVD
jgi:hypothetical protein